MTILNKAVNCLAAAALVSTFGFAGAAAASAADGDIPYVADVWNYTNDMTLDLEATPYLFTDTNGDGFTNAGDTVNYTLKVTNTGVKDYTYVDVSGYKAGLERLKLADTLKAGETLTKEMTYVIRADDLLAAGTPAGSKLTVNVRDASQLEASRSTELVLNPELYNCNKVMAIVNNLLDYCIDRVDPENAVMRSSNGYVVYDVATDEYYVSDDSQVEEFLKASGKTAIVVGGDLATYVKPGNRIYSTFEVSNADVTDFTITDIVNAYKLGDNNAISATVKAGETTNLYFSEAIDVDSIDWSFQNQLGSGTSISVKTSNGKWLTSPNGNGATRNIFSAQSSIEMKFKDNNDGTFDVNFIYSGQNVSHSTLVPRAFVSQWFGSFDIAESFDGNKLIVKELPTIESVPQDSMLSEKGYMIAYGKYFTSLAPNPASSSISLPTSLEPIDPIDPVTPTPVDPVDPIEPVVPVVPDPVVPVIEIPETPAPVETPEPKKFIQSGEVTATSSSSENAGLLVMLLGGALATGVLAIVAVRGKVFRKRRAAHRA